MLNAASDEYKHPELNGFLKHGCPFKFHKECERRRKKEMEIKREISATSDFPFIVVSESDRADYSDNNALQNITAELNSFFDSPCDFDGAKNQFLNE